MAVPKLILLPLDGSQVSEGAIPYAVAVARATGARLLLMTAWEGSDVDLSRTYPEVARELSDLADEYYASYLRGVTHLADNVETESIVRRGEPGDEILSVIKERKPDLLVMASHGRSGISRWVYGSVAGRLVREAPVPTMVLGPKVLERERRPEHIEKILVPLDGSPLAERALPYAVSLGDALNASIVLVRAVRWAAQAYPYTLPDAYVPQIDSELADGAKEYLDRMAGGMKTAKPVTTVVLRGIVVDSLLDYAEREKADLVVMTTHARSGIARMALGSVADRLIQGAAPVLLFRPEMLEAD